MLCPQCQHDESKVVDSRTVARDGSIRRRRECLSCGNRFTTYEYIMKQPLLVVKKDGQRVEYDRDRILRSIQIAANKRPVSAETILDAVSDIHRQIEEVGKGEVTSKRIGDLVMAKLKELDEIAYVRFASVYRAFEDLGAFEAEIEQLRE